MEKILFKVKKQSRVYWFQACFLSTEILLNLTQKISIPEINGK